MNFSMFRVHPDSQLRPSSNNWTIGENLLSSIEYEKDRHVQNFEERMKSYKDIVENKTSGRTSSMHIVKGLVGILGPLVSSMAYTMIPVQNVFTIPVLEVYICYSHFFSTTWTYFPIKKFSISLLKYS